MIKEIKLEGKIVTAVILGDAIEHDPEMYRYASGASHPSGTTCFNQARKGGHQ